MRSLQVLVLLSSSALASPRKPLAPAAAAAAPVAAAAQEQGGAAAAWKELEAKHMNRMRGLERGDNDKRDALLKERQTEIEAFAKQFPKSAEASKAYLEVAQIAGIKKDEAAVKAARLAGAHRRLAAPRHDVGGAP